MGGIRGWNSVVVGWAQHLLVDDSGELTGLKSAAWRPVETWKNKSHELSVKRESL